MYLNAIYTTFNGEVNKWGIGSSVIFVRLQGCPIRCYAKTLGILCDTPEGLEKPTERTDIADILNQIDSIRNRTGIDKITLTGGDPLWNKPSDLHELFSGLLELGIGCSVETSGTIDWREYLDYVNVSFVVDYKGKSAGVTGNLLAKSTDYLRSLRCEDWIKFVVYGSDDLDELVELYNSGFFEFSKNKAKIAVGAYWGGNIGTIELFQFLEKNGLAGRCQINAQLHKLILNPDFSVKVPQKL